MNRIDRRFGELQRAGRKGLIPYVVAGHPDLESTRGLLPELCDAGADLIELGLPFSDPMADGPVIQKACEHAVSAGIGVDQVLDAVAGFRTSDDATPIILMGYLNPVVRYGIQGFAAAAARAGVDGLLMVDAPPEEASILEPVKAAGIHSIFLLAPTSPEARIEKVAGRAEGFIYYVSLTGITGASHLRTEAVAGKVATIRAVSNLPIAVGFGIKSPEDAVAVAGVADAVVIGSALVAALESADGPEAAAVRAREFLAPIRSALNQSELERSGS